VCWNSKKWKRGREEGGERNEVTNLTMDFKARHNAKGGIWNPRPAFWLSELEDARLYRQRSKDKSSQVKKWDWFIDTLDTELIPIRTHTKKKSSQSSNSVIRGREYWVKGQDYSIKWREGKHLSDGENPSFWLHKRSFINSGETFSWTRQADPFWSRHPFFVLDIERR
jgi:hypothetical protein